MTNKFKAKRTKVENISFHSAKEARKYSELKLLETIGEITGLELQPTFKFSFNGIPVVIKSKGYPNGRQVTYRADFAYFDVRKNRRVVLDVKGVATEAFKIKRAFCEAMFPGTTIETC